MNRAPLLHAAAIVSYNSGETTLAACWMGSIKPSLPVLSKVISRERCLSCSKRRAFRGEAWVEHVHVRLVVQTQGAQVEITRADGDEGAVDDHQLHMVHRGFVFVDANPSLEQLGQMFVGRDPDDFLVDVFSGDDDLDFRAVFGGIDQFFAHKRIGQEGGVLDQEAFLRASDRERPTAGLAKSGRGRGVKRRYFVFGIARFSGGATAQEAEREQQSQTA